MSGVSHLRVVYKTSQLVAPVAEVVVHAPSTEMHPAGGQCHSYNQTCLLADVFGSPDHDLNLGGDDMAPLEHHLASGRPLILCLK